MNGCKMEARRVDSREVVLAIVHTLGTVPGRTVLQKVSYFLNNSLDLGIEFKPYFYGPYSEEIAVATDNLVGYGFLEEESQRLSIATGDDPEFESKQYKYSLTPRGKRLVEVRSGNLPEYKLVEKKIRDFKKNGLNLQNANLLAAIAKIAFIMIHEERKLGRNEIAAIARDLGWKMSPEQVAQLLDYMNAEDRTRMLGIPE
jgi:hypothetical protein